MTIVAFALAGVWVTQINGYEVVSMMDTNGPSNPLGKTVVMSEGAWLNNYSNYPITMIAPVLGFLGAIGVVILSGTKRDGLNFTCSSLAQAGIIMTAGFSLFPFVLTSSTDPSYSLTLWDATSSYPDTGHYDWSCRSVRAHCAWLHHLVFLQDVGRMTAEQIEQDGHSHLLNRGV